MSRRLLPCLIAAGIATAAVPVTAQGVDQNMRCLLASNVFANAEKDPAKKQVAVGASLFYLGRLNPAVTPAQLKAQVIAQGKALNPQNAGPTMNACVQEIAAKQRAMQAVGQEIQRTQAKK